VINISSVKKKREKKTWKILRKILKKNYEFAAITLPVKKLKNLTKFSFL
jgi:hypothetical protein